MESSLPPVGRRERSKLDKRMRISAAARAVFNEFGYARANMREIAKRAGVATGTLFLYSPDKRNLLLWILNDDLEEVTTATFGALERDHSGDSLLDQLMFIFEARYRYWGADPDLSLHALQELIISRDAGTTPVSSHLASYQARRVLMFDRLRDVVAAQQRAGFIDAEVDPDVIGRMTMAIYNSAIRTWLRSAETPVFETGVAELRRLLALALHGCLKTS
jgi:AcrR family transcriptional regulator